MVSQNEKSQSHPPSVYYAYKVDWSCSNVVSKKEQEQETKQNEKHSSIIKIEAKFSLTIKLGDLLRVTIKLIK